MHGVCFTDGDFLCVSITRRRLCESAADRHTTQRDLFQQVERGVGVEADEIWDALLRCSSRGKIAEECDVGSADASVLTFDITHNNNVILVRYVAAAWQACTAAWPLPLYRSYVLLTRFACSAGCPRATCASSALTRRACCCVTWEARLAHHE